MASLLAVPALDSGVMVIPVPRGFGVLMFPQRPFLGGPLSIAGRDRIDGLHFYVIKLVWRLLPPWQQPGQVWLLCCLIE